jgi:hypothetical protein
MVDTSNLSWESTSKIKAMSLLTVHSVKIFDDRYLIWENVEFKETVFLIINRSICCRLTLENIEKNYLLFFITFAKENFAHFKNKRSKVKFAYNSLYHVI